MHTGCAEIDGCILHTRCDNSCRFSFHFSLRFTIPPNQVPGNPSLPPLAMQSRQADSPPVILKTSVDEAPLASRFQDDRAASGRSYDATNLLASGDKSTQDGDINQAVEIAKEWKR